MSLSFLVGTTVGMWISCSYGIFITTGAWQELGKVTTRKRFQCRHWTDRYRVRRVSNPGPQLRVCNWKLFFLFLNQNICCGYSKEPSWEDSSIEHPKHMFKLMDKKIITILRKLFLFNWPYGNQSTLQLIYSILVEFTLRPKTKYLQFLFFCKINKNEPSQQDFNA